MSFVDAMGYLASLLVLLTFCMRTMLTLRLVAIGSNLAFIGFGFEAAVYPVLVLHLLLLPLNIFHLFKATLISQRAKRAAATDLSADWLRPFMRLRQMKPGEVVFFVRRGVQTVFVEVQPTWVEPKEASR